MGSSLASWGETMEIPYDYKWFTGRVMSKSMTDHYNRLTDQINVAKAAGLKSHVEDLELRRFNLGVGVVYNFEK